MGPFQKGTPETAKVVHAVWCCLSVCAQFSENWQPNSIRGETILADKDFLQKIYSSKA